MKLVFLFSFQFVFVVFSYCQNIAIAASKMNVFYVGVENPVAIAAEKYPSKSIIVQADYGTITCSNGNYIFRIDKKMPVNIILYTKVNQKLKEIGRAAFRVKDLPPPLFKVGSGRSRMPLAEFKNQEYARAGDRDDEIYYTIQKFTMCVFAGDTCRYVEKENVGARFNKELLDEFNLLKPNDVLIFKNIIVTRKGQEDTIELEPKMITLY